MQEVDLSNNGISRSGALAAASAVKDISGFKLLNLNGNAIPDDGIDEIRKILSSGKAGVDVLGPLDENDEEGFEEDDDENEEEEEGEEAGELEEKLGNLSI